MQSDKQHTTGLDDDILQCKADLQRALQAAKRLSPQRIAPAAPPDASEDLPRQEIQDEAISESTSNEPAAEDRPQSPVGIRILPFEAIHKTKPSMPAQSPPSLSEESNEPEKGVDDGQESIDLLHEQVLSSDDENHTTVGEQAGRTDKDAEPLIITEQSADTLRTQIESLEHELAEKITLIATLKQQIDDTAAALAEHADQLRHAGNEKEMAEKQLEAKTAEWIQTIETLKAAQQSAVNTLSEREQQLAIIRKELSDAESRLEQADAANAELSRKNSELADLLQHTQRDPYGDDDSVLGYEIDAETQEEQFLEPYCEPVDEVISEDDVHLEQKLTDTAIPIFNLADQIMAEQRKVSAERRRGPGAAGEKTTPNSSIERVMQQYVSSPADSENSIPPSRPAAIPQRQPAGQPDRFLRWHGESLSTYQESLLGTIIQKDIRRFCGMGRPVTGIPRPMDN